MSQQGLFFEIDGITGGGKTTVVNAIYEWVKTHYRCFRLEDWTKDRPPTFDDVKDADVLFTYEPTRQWVGATIRHEMSRLDQPYSGKSLAHAFSLDREIMYRRLILPALAAGKIVIQDRGVTTSLAIQSVMPNSLSVEEIASLPGNKLALEHAPNELIILSIPPEMAAERIAKRGGESKGVFGKLELLRAEDAQFHSEWFREMFESRGTRIHSLDTSGTLEQSQENAVALISSLLTTRTQETK